MYFSSSRTVSKPSTRKARDPSYRVISLIATLVTKSRLIRKQEILVGREQANRVVQRTGIRQVIGHEIVVPGPSSWELALGRLGWRLHQAERGVDEVGSLFDGHVAPEIQVKSGAITEG